MRLPAYVAEVGVVVLSACGPGFPVAVLDPDTDASAAAGTRGPWGVLQDRRRVAVSPTTTRVVDVFAPTADGREPAVDRPLTVIIQGGFVTPDRYAWLGAHLASRGYVAAVPRHRLDAALLEPDVPGRTRRALLEDPERGEWLARDTLAVPIGHSLGGVSASAWLSREPEVLAGAVLLASTPAPGAPIEDTPARPILGLTGDADGLIAPDEVADGLARFPGPTEMVVIPGMTHFQWTDDVSRGDIRRDAEPTRPDADVRAEALAPLDAFLAVHLPGPDAPAADTDR